MIKDTYFGFILNDNLFTYLLLLFEKLRIKHSLEEQNN
jgi:hypothetical protein